MLARKPQASANAQGGLSVQTLPDAYCDVTQRAREAEKGFKLLHDSQVLLVQWKGKMIFFSLQSIRE